MWTSTSDQPASEPADRDRPVGWRIDALLAVALLLLSGPLVHEYQAYPASRYALTVSIVDEHSLEIDSYEQFLSIDRASYRGHTYSHTAPYQSFVAVPFYQAFRWVGGEAFPRVNGQFNLFGGVLRGVWWVTLWSSTIPGIALVVTIRRLVAKVDPTLATRVAVAVVAGTTILPFTSVFFGHVLSALAVTCAWFLLRDAKPGLRRAGLAGLSLGFGIGTEYTVALVALVLLVAVVLRRRWGAAMAMSVGTVVAVLPLLLYHWLVFENPFETAYQGHLPNFQGAGALGVYNLQGPRLVEIGKALLGDRGLFLLTPVALVAVAGCWWAIRERLSTRLDAGLALVSLALMLLVSTGIDGLGGASPGPRYLIVVLPLFVIPLVEAWRRVPFLCAGTAIIGAVNMIVCTITDPLGGPTLFDWWGDLLHGEVTDNVFTGSSQAWIVYVSTAAAVALVVQALRLDQRSNWNRATGSARMA